MFLPFLLLQKGTIALRKYRHILFNIACLCLIVFGASALLPRAQAASSLTASEDCVSFIKTVEGFSPQPYYDYNQYTVGYGTKCPTEKYFEYKANGIPRSEADALLQEFLTEIADTLNKKLIDKYNLALNQHQFDALVSFSFNIGTGWVTYDSTLRNAILRNAGEDEIVYAFGLYCTAGGKYLPGLITRRLCEANMYLNGVYHQKVSDSYGYVYYDANGGSLTYRVQGFVSGNNTTPIANATHSDDVFLGWYTNVTGGNLVTTLDKSLSGRTLFARWQSSENPENQTTTTTTVRVTGDIVNVRSGPSTNYSIVRKAYQNEILTVTHVSHITSMKWGNIQDGWICLDYTNYDAVINGTDNNDAGTPQLPSADTTVPENNAASNPPPQSNPIVASGVVQVNDALRIRSGPGTNHTVVGFLFNGKEVDILELQTVGTMVWGKISTGWVSMDYIVTDTIREDVPPAPAPDQIPETQPQQPPTQPPAPQPEQIPTEQPTEPPAETTQPPAVQEPVATVGPAESVFLRGTIKADALRIRSSAGTANSIVGFYYQNDVVEITEKVMIDSVYWGKTNRGWINMDYFVEASSSPEVSQPAADGTMTVIADCLRVRKGTSTDYKISALLYFGDKVTVLETVTVDGTEWGRISQGWICMDYVN